jgi:hypothetical protein
VEQELLVKVSVVVVGLVGVTVPQVVVVERVLQVLIHL